MLFNDWNNFSAPSCVISESFSDGLTPKLIDSIFFFFWGVFMYAISSVEVHSICRVVLMIRHIGRGRSEALQGSSFVAI
jgi:hypothetical protein